MKYSDFAAFCSDALVDTPWEGVAFHPGPDDLQAPAGRFVLLTRIGGPGFSMEYLFDQVGYQVTSVGEQEDFEDAEGLALALDQVLVMARSQNYADLRLLQITRQGGAPSPLIVDDADRTRFVCSYIVEVESYAA